MIVCDSFYNIYECVMKGCWMLIGLRDRGKDG